MKRFIHVIFFYMIIIQCGILNAAPDSRITFNQGIEAFKAGNYSSAELLFRKTLENDDEYRDKAWFYLCRTIYQQEKYRAAIFEFNSFLTKCRTENLRVESRFWIGESYYFLNEYLKAIEEYNRFLEKTDDKLLTITAHDRIASIYYKQSRYEEAIIEWEKAIQKSEDKQQNVVLIIKIGEALFQNGQYDAALERMNPLLTEKIDNNEKARARLLVGRIYQLQNDHKKALLMFNAIPRELAGVYPFHDIYYYRALSYLAQDKESQAKADLELFYMIGKKSDYYADGMFELGKILIRSPKPESGIELLVKVWESEEKISITIKSGLILANFYLEKEPLQSVRFLEKYTSIEDEDLRKQVLVTLSKAYIKTGKYDKAQILLKTYSEKYPYDENIDEILFLKARISLEMGDIDKATEYFDQIKNEHPFSKFLDDTEYYMALINYKKEKYAEAIANLKKYFSKKEVNNAFGAHLLLNELYLKTGDLKNAEKELQILLGKFPDYAGMDRVLYNFSMMMYEKKGEAADRYFSMLQSMYPESSYAIQVNYLYGSRYYQKDNYAKAIPYFEKFLNSNVEENRGNAFYFLINSYYRIKQYEKVIEILKNAKIPPMNEEQWKEIPLINARCYYSLGKFEDVYNILKWEDIRTLRDDDARMLIACTIKTGDIASAQKLIETVKEKTEIYIDAMMMLGDYYRDKKDTGKAQDIYSEILISGEKEERKERARLELAVINTDAGASGIALELLQNISSSELIADRDALIIINQFNSGNEKAAADLSDAKSKQFSGSRFEEKVLLLNILYHYEQKNEKSFLKYAALLKKYPDDELYVNYLSAKLYYEKGSYDKAFTFYNRLSSGENIYTSESFYYLGKISLIQSKNKNNAIRYFTSVIESVKIKNEYYFKSKIELSIINYELKNNDAAEEILDEIITENLNIRYTIEAENLKEFYTKKIQ